MRGYCDYCEEFSENIENVWRDEIENWVDLCPDCQDEEKLQLMKVMTGQL